MQELRVKEGGMALEKGPNEDRDYDKVSKGKENGTRGGLVSGTNGGYTHGVDRALSDELIAELNEVLTRHGQHDISLKNGVGDPSKWLAVAFAGGRRGREPSRSSRKGSALALDVVSLLSQDQRLRDAVERGLRAAGVGSALSPAVSEGILRLCDDHLQRFEDPQTKLTFPAPHASVPFTKSRFRFVRDHAVAEWPRYVETARLFLEDVFRCDPTLWRACRHHAEQEGVSVYEYAESVGILSRPIIAKNPRKYADQRLLLKAIDATNRSTAYLLSRHDLLVEAAMK